MAGIHPRLPADSALLPSAPFFCDFGDVRIRLFVPSFIQIRQCTTPTLKISSGRVVTEFRFIIEMPAKTDKYARPARPPELNLAGAAQHLYSKMRFRCGIKHNFDPRDHHSLRPWTKPAISSEPNKNWEHASQTRASREFTIPSQVLVSESGSTFSAKAARVRFRRAIHPCCADRAEKIIFLAFARGFLAQTSLAAAGCAPREIQQKS